MQCAVVGVCSACVLCCAALSFPSLANGNVALTRSLPKGWREKIQPDPMLITSPFELGERSVGRSGGFRRFQAVSWPRGQGTYRT